MYRCPIADEACSLANSDRPYDRRRRRRRPVPLLLRCVQRQVSCRRRCCCCRCWQSCARMSDASPGELTACGNLRRTSGCTDFCACRSRGRRAARARAGVFCVRSNCILHMSRDIWPGTGQLQMLAGCRRRNCRIFPNCSRSHAPSLGDVAVRCSPRSEVKRNDSFMLHVHKVGCRRRGFARSLQMLDDFQHQYIYSVELSWKQFGLQAQQSFDPNSRITNCDDGICRKCQLTNELYHHPRYSSDQPHHFDDFLALALS